MILVTTSNSYRHLLPIMAMLFNKYWPAAGEEDVCVIGYDEPLCELPDNFHFVSMGKQGPVSEWSTDIAKYIRENVEDEFFCWFMEDTLLRSVSSDQLDMAFGFTGMPNVGRIGLTKDIQNREHTVGNAGEVYAHPASRYRLSTQPSIWNKTFLLQYMTDGMDPWEMETQDPVNDGWNIVALKDYPVLHNEGVNKRDPWALDLGGFGREDTEEINRILNEQKLLYGKN